MRRGLAWLVSTQRADGTWEEQHYTGTGFMGYGTGGRQGPHEPHAKPRMDQGAELRNSFMMRYNLYRQYFPLMALGRARAALGRADAPLGNRSKGQSGQMHRNSEGTSAAASIATGRSRKPHPC